MRVTTIRWAGLALTGALALAACGGGDDSSSASVPSVTTAAPAATTPTSVTAATNLFPSATTAATTATTSPASAKVSANDATRAELQAAFTAAGISSPAQWAREVEEYRPYPADDPTFAKLRHELTKYNPGPGVVDQIVATLAP